MDSNYYIKILLKLKYLILASGFVSAIVTVALLTFKDKVFVSKAQLATGITSKEEVTMNKVETNWNMISSKYNNFLEFINSKEIYSLLTYKLVLHDLNVDKKFRAKQVAEMKAQIKPEVDEVSKHLQSKYDSLQVLYLEKEGYLQNIAKRLRYDIKSTKKLMTVTRIPNTDFIKVEARTENPQLSAFIVNTFCEEVIRFYKFRELERLGNSVSFFKEMADRKKRELDGKLDTLKRYKSYSNLIDYKEQSRSKVDQEATLEESKNDETRKITGYRNAIRQIDSQLSGAEQNIYKKVEEADNPAIEIYQNKISNLNRRYVSSGMSDQKILDSVLIYRAKLSKEINTFSETSFAETAIGKSNPKEELMARKMNYEIELSISEASLEYINSAISNLQRNISTLARDESAISRLELGVEVAKGEYLSMLEKYNAAENISFTDSENLQQIEFGQPADEPEPAKRGLFSILAAVAAILVTCSIIILTTYFDSEIRTPEILSSSSKLPLIGILNKLNGKKFDLHHLFSDQNQNVDINKFKELLRKLRYEIEACGSKVFLFTSTHENSGKSFSIMSIAYSLTQKSKKILIIDTNFKNNTLTKLSEGKQNLEQYFGSHSESVEYAFPQLDEPNKVRNEALILAENSYMKNFISNTGFDGIDIIGCKASMLSPSEILSGKNFKELIKDLSKMYDYIFLEGAAMNMYVDSKELSDYVERIITVFSAEDTIKAQDRVSIAFLKSLKAKSLGTVLNKVNGQYVTT